MKKGFKVVLLWVLAVLLPGFASAALPKPAHVVIVMEENQDYSTIVGSGNACPYINSLATGGALMTNSYGCGHQSEDNYDSLFFGNPENAYGDPCPNNVDAVPSLGNSLLTNGYTFCGYSEGIPAAGSTVCSSGEYVLRHCPWIQALTSVSGNLPVTCAEPFTAFPTNYAGLPTVSFVIPNLDDDMHDGTPAAADTWLKNNLGAYATYCQTASNNSLLIVQWDEDATGGSEGDGSTVGNTSDNHIATVVYGAAVTPGQYPESAPVNHYNILNTLLTMYGLAPIGDSVGVATITDIFGSSTPASTNTPTKTFTPAATHTPTYTPTKTPTPGATSAPTDTPTKTYTPAALTPTPTTVVCLPRPEHVLIVMESDQAYTSVIGSVNAPYINGTLVAHGALMTDYTQITSDASEPNGTALFAGTTESLTGDTCPTGPFISPNLAQGLLAAGLTFDAYSELLPSAGSTVCTSGTSPTQYVAKHDPWVFFSNVPGSVELPYTSFPTNYANLPTVAYVIPDTDDDMRSASVTLGDTWLKNNINAYYQWAMGHNSLLIVTFDYTGGSSSAQIATIFDGPMVVSGSYSGAANHYNLLATLEDMFGLPLTGSAATAAPLTQVFNCTGVFPTVTNTPTNTPTKTNTPVPTPTHTPTPVPQVKSQVVPAKKK